MSEVAQDGINRFSHIGIHFAVNLKKKNIENQAAVVLISDLMIASEFLFYNLKEDSTRSYERQGFLIRFEVDLTLPQSQCNVCLHFTSTFHFLVLIRQIHIDNWLKSQAKPMTKYVFLFNDILLITEMEKVNTGITSHL
jgi:hypothetical protein